MAPRTRGDHFGLKTGIDSLERLKTSRLVVVTLGILNRPLSLKR